MEYDEFEHDILDQSNDDSDLKEIDEKRKKRSGRKSTWNPDDVNDLIDIVVNSDYYKRKLIFTNTKCQRNSEIYGEILRELKKRALARGSELNFSVKQLRTKFKKCVSDCKHAALTIKNASGIKRFQESRGLGDWFKALYPVVKTRDSCNPGLAIEPDTFGASPSPSNSEALDDDETLRSLEEKDDGRLFVPIKKTKRCNTKQKLEDAVVEVVGLIKETIRNDSSKEMFNFLREEMDKSREHELKLIQLLNTCGDNCQQQSSKSNPLSGNIHSFDNGQMVANYSQYHGTYDSNTFSQQGFPPQSVASFTQSSFTPCTSAQGYYDGKIYDKL